MELRVRLPAAGLFLVFSATTRTVQPPLHSTLLTYLTYLHSILIEHMVYSSPAAWLRLWLCACCCVLPLPTLAQEDPKNVYLWWDHKEHGHHDLIARLKKYSASLPQRQKPAASEEEEQQGGTEPNPLIEAFERTNTHAFVIQGPHPVRASNVRNFSRALGFTESGGKHLTKIHTVL
jgi:hypothetical protein